MLQRKWKQSEDMAEEIVNVEEVNDNVIDSVDETRHNLDDKHRKIVEWQNEIMLEGKTSDGIMFKEIDNKTLKVQTIELMMWLSILKAKTSQKMNDLIKATRVWVAEQIGLKKRDYREKTNLDGNAELKEI